MDERVERVKAEIAGYVGPSLIDGVARDIIAALDAEPLEDVLLSSGLVSELPGYGFHIAYSGEEWHVSQEYCGLSETFDTGIVGTAPTIADAIRNAIAAAQGDE